MRVRRSLACLVKSGKNFSATAKFRRSSPLARKGNHADALLSMGTRAIEARRDCTPSNALNDVAYMPVRHTAVCTNVPIISAHRDTTSNFSRRT